VILSMLGYRPAGDRPGDRITRPVFFGVFPKKRKSAFSGDLRAFPADEYHGARFRRSTRRTRYKANSGGARGSGRMLNGKDGKQ
jgi:hypothetical protein